MLIVIIYINIYWLYNIYKLLQIKKFQRSFVIFFLVSLSLWLVTYRWSIRSMAHQTNGLSVYYILSISSSNFSQGESDDESVLGRDSLWIYFPMRRNEDQNSDAGYSNEPSITSRARAEFVLHCTVSFASITMLGLTCQLMICAQIYVTLTCSSYFAILNRNFQSGKKEHFGKIIRKKN